MREFVKLGNFVVKDEEARRNNGTKLYLHRITFTPTMVSPDETADEIMIISTKSTPYTSFSSGDFSTGGIIQFFVRAQSDSGVVTWGTLRTIGETTIQLHTFGHPTISSITTHQINNGLVDTVTEL